jgi:hypothetical protein
LDKIYPKGLQPGTRWSEGRKTGLEPQNGLLARIFGLTPRSRAVEALGILGDSMKVLMDQYAEPAAIAQAMKRVAALTGLNAEDISLRFIGTPEGAYLIHALKDFNATTVQELLKLWEDPGIAAKRDVLNLVAKLMNERPYDVLRRLEDADGRAPFFEALMKEVTTRAQQGDATAAQVLEAAKSGIFSKEALSDMFGLFMGKNVPFHPEQWKAMLFDAWMSHVGKWTVERLGVRVEPLVTRLADVMKSAQSLLLLDINPNYFVNNAVNNIATMTIDGSMGMKSISQSLDWWSQFGIYPFKLRQAFGGPSELGDVHVGREKLAAGEMGFMDLAFKSEGNAAKTISDAAKGKGGLRVADDWLKNIRSKVGVFSKLSRKVEEWSSVQATTKGTQQFWNAQWRAGKGYRRMPPALEQLLGPDLSKLVYGLVDGSLSMKQIEDGLVEGQYIHRSIESFADDVSKALGMDRDMVSTVMNESGATEFLRQHLPDAKTPDEVRGVFSLMRAAVQKHIDDLIVAEHVTRIGTTAAQVKVGDWLGFVDAMKDLDRQFDDWWTQHILKMNDAMGQASKVEDHGVRNQLIASRMAEADMEGRRITSMQIATVEGIEQGFRDAGVGFPENYSNIFRSQFDGWREFFTQRDSQWRDFWAKVQSKELPFGSKDFKEEYVRVTTEMDNAYGRQALETMHFMEEMDDAIVRMIADSDAELADKVGIYFAELRDHKAVQMAREQNIRRAMTQIRIKGKPTGKQVASILKSIFKGDDEWLKAIDPWLKELADQPVVNAFEINNRLYREYTENLKIPSISERENIRIQNERNIVEPTVKVPTEKVEVDKGAKEALVEEGLPGTEAEKAAIEIDKGPEVKTIPETVRTEALAAPDLDGIRAAASEAGINTATADGRPMDNWLVNWINSDEGIGLRKSGTPIRRLDELDPGEYPAVIRKLEERKLRNGALIKIAQERGMTLDALKYLEDGKASTARLRKIAVQNGMPEVIANLAPKPIMSDWLRAKRDGVPYRGPGDRLMTLKSTKDLLQEMTKGSIEGEPQLNDVLTIWEQMAKSEGMSLDEWIMRRLASDDPGIAESLYQMQGVNHPYTQAAIARFGVAGDIRKAGCVLRDGSLLDVGEVEPGRQIDPLLEVGGEIEFLSKTGNIRVDFDGDSMNLVTYGLLSKEQRLAIENLVRRHNPYRVSLELRSKNRSGYGHGGTAAYFEAKDVTSIDDLNKMFAQLDDTGAGTLYQIADAAKGMRDPAVKRAVNHFGLTDNIDRAGYMLADGSMLDFGDASKSKFGWIATGFERKVEHMEIGAVYTGQPSFEAVNDFLRSTNSLRVTAGPKRIMFETHKPLTMEQMIALNDTTLKTGRTIFGEYRDPKTGEIKGYGADPNIESLSQMWSDFDEATNRTLYQQATKRWYFSTLDQLIQQRMPPKMTGTDFINWMVSQGAKKDEIYWTGIDDWAKAQDTPITKAEAMQYIKDNQIELTETVRRDRPDFAIVHHDLGVAQTILVEKLQEVWGSQLDIANAPNRLWDGRMKVEDLPESAREAGQNYIDASERFKDETKLAENIQKVRYGGRLNLPGGEDYREIELTMPSRMSLSNYLQTQLHQAIIRARNENVANQVAINWGDPDVKAFARRLAPAEAEAYESFIKRFGINDYYGSHWDEPNVVVHARTDIRRTPDGRKILFIEEVQSDWIGEVRRDLALTQIIPVPDVPWKNDWYGLAIKRLLRMAAEEGCDGIAWTTGKQQVERNFGQLESVADTLVWEGRGESGEGVLFALKGGSEVRNWPLIETDLPRYIGEDVAKVLLSSPLVDGSRKLVLGEMPLPEIGFHYDLYDKWIPSWLKKYTKRWGADVGRAQVSGEMPVTNSMPWMIIDKETGYVHNYVLSEVEAGRGVALYGADRYISRPNPDYGKEVYYDVNGMYIEPEMKSSVLYEGQKLFQMPFDDGLANQRAAALESLRQMGIDQLRIDEILTKRNLEGLDPQARAIALEAIALTDAGRMADKTGYSFGDHISWLRKQYGGDFTVRVEQVAAKMPALGEAYQRAWKVVDDKTGITLATFTDETTAGIAAKVINEGGYAQGAQAPKASVTFLEDTRVVMRALENPDVSSAIHETGHIMLRHLPQQDIDIALKWYREEYKGEVDTIDDGTIIGLHAEDFQEKFSRAFERYFAEGHTPFKALEAVFERMKRWLLDVYHAIVGSEIDVKLTDEMRDLFARQLSGDPELRQQVGEFYGPRPKAAPVEEPAAPMDVSIGGQLHTQPLTLERWLWDRKRAIEAAAKIEDPNTRIESIQEALKQSDSVKEAGWMPSDAVAQDALARAKAELRSVEGIPGLTGKGTAAHGADPSRYYDFVYRVVELDDLVASHKMNGDPNPDYPTAFQPRQRDRVASRQQVIRIASELEPDALLYQSQRIDDGAPIVGNDLIVESGNGRVLGLRLATDEYPENYRSYKDKLLQDATVYGLDPEALRQMDKPILVRQRVSDVDREAFVREANESATAAMSFTENAASDAKMIGDDVLGALYVGETQSIEQVLRSPSNRNFVQNFINMIPRNEQGIMVDANGEISRIGIQRIIAALFAKTFGGDAGEKLTRLALESVDVDVKRVISGIQAALPELARAEALIAAGRRPETLSIGDDIAAAATKLQHLRTQGMKIDDYLGQTQMFGDDLTGFQKRLLMDFGMAQSAKAIREPLLYYGRQIQAQPDTSQTGMFGSYQYPDKAQLWYLARQQGQEQLFQMPPEVGGKMGKGIPEPLYMGSLQQEAWDNIQPVMNEMERRMSAGDGWTKTFKRADLDAALGDQRGDFVRWINDLRPDMASTKHQAIRWGENVRDWSLLNYQARRGFDGPMSMLMPYFFWPSRTFLRWALRTIDRPGLMANYVRFNQVASMYQTENFPSRLKGKWRIPLPFLPEWMGGGIYVDPFRQWFPPAMFAENIMRAVTEKDRETKNAAYLLEKWVSEGKASQVEAQQALLTMEGDLWDEAIETVQAEEQGEYSGPLDYLGLLSNLAMPFDILHQYARGTPERIQPLPITRLVKGVTAPFGIGGPGGVNIEAPLRKAVDLPVFDRFEEYRIERMVANMVAEGEIDPKIAEQVFLSHQGPEWDEAEKRVNQARFFGTYANPLFWMGMPADSFPTGEAKLRGLTAEWNRAIDSYHKGDDGALRRMLEEYPEYQFRMDLWKDPNERLRWFLVDEIWTKYNELGSSNKELVRMQLGEDFQQMFLDKPPEGESRNYESIPFELLAFWAQAIGAQLPPLPERNNGYEMPKIEPVAPEQQVSLLPPEVANEIDTFRAERNSQFPNWFAIQQRYFDQPKGDARKAYLAANPELKHYWDWKKQYYAQHPTVDTYYQRYNLSDEEGQEVANWSVPEILSNPVLMRQILAQQTIGEPLSSGALEELRRIWESMGKPGNSFDQFISEVVSSSNQ